MGEVIDIYGGRDPREVPLYSVREAAGYLSIPTSTLRSWVRGQRYTVRGKARTSKPLISCAMSCSRRSGKPIKN